MKPYKYILALDPSGNFHEGKGTTGWCLFNSSENRILTTDIIEAKSYESMQEYWNAHLKLIKEFKYHYPIVVVEDYLLYGSKAQNQVNSKMETPKLIGVLQHYLWEHLIPHAMQPASEVKTRWADTILAHKGYFDKKGQRYIMPKTQQPINKHVKDSIRHAVHYHTFKNKKKEG